MCCLTCGPHTLSPTAPPGWRGLSPAPEPDLHPQAVTQAHTGVTVGKQHPRTSLGTWGHPASTPTQPGPTLFWQDFCVSSSSSSLSSSSFWWSCFIRSISSSSLSWT